MPARVLNAVTLELQSPRTAERVPMRALMVSITAASGEVPAILLVEPRDSTQVSLTNGAEFYWAEALQQLGLSEDQVRWRLFQGREVGPTRIQIMEEVLPYGEIETRRTEADRQQGRPHFPAVRWGAVNDYVKQCLTQVYAASFGGRVSEIPPVMMAP